MISKIFVIAFLRVGSVLMEANLKEFCSRNYFDNFVVKNEEHLRIDFQLSRRIGSNSYHSWNLLMEEDKGSVLRGFKTINMSYELKEGQTPTNNLSQPNSCVIQMRTKLWYRKGGLNWPLKDFLIINHRINGPKLNYRRPDSGYQYEPTETPLNGSGIWLSGIFCRHHKTELPKNPDIYVIVEQTNSMNAWDRTQFVSRLIIEPGPMINETTELGMPPRPTPEFWLDSMDKTIVDFFGVQCPNITIDEHTVPTKTLFILMCVLGVIAVILMIAILVVVKLRRKWIKYPTESTDGTDVTTYDSEASRKRNRIRPTPQEYKEAFRLMGARNP